IRDALAWLARDAASGDTLVMALSGHGLKEGDRYYFAPVETDPARLAATALPWSEVVDALPGAQQRAHAVWVLADCCRAAPGRAGSAFRREQQATGADLQRALEPSGNLILCTASRGDRPSYESAELGHGLFTQAWLEALRGEAPAALYLESPLWGRYMPL